MPVVDEVSPAEYGQNLIGLSLSPSQTPRQFEPVSVDVDYSKCLPADVVLPLEFTVTSESGGALFQRRLYRRFKPPALTFTPREGGSHLVRLAETHHNRWFGALQIEVAGERVSER